MKTFIFGHTSLGRPILAHQFGNLGPEVLILGGVHGDETEGVTLALGLIDRLSKSFPAKLKLTIAPHSILTAYLQNLASMPGVLISIETYPPRIGAHSLLIHAISPALLRRANQRIMRLCDLSKPQISA